MTVIIAVYDKKRNLIGYKADSFWSLTKTIEHAKVHWHSEGESFLNSQPIDNLKAKLEGFLNALNMETIYLDVVQNGRIVIETLKADRSGIRVMNYSQVKDKATKPIKNGFNIV